MSSSFNITKVGLVGTGRIAERFVAEARYASGLIVTSAYNPDIESVNDFKKNCSEYEIDMYTDNYDEFLEKIDAIYIASTPSKTAFNSYFFKDSNMALYLSSLTILL